MTNATEIIKINESYSILVNDDKTELKRICTALTIEDENSAFKARNRIYGMGLDKVHFFRIIDNKHTLSEYIGNIVIPNGLIQYLELLKFNLTYTNHNSSRNSQNEPGLITDMMIDEYVSSFDKILPFKPYEHQLRMVNDALKIKCKMLRACTGSGKSLSIALISNFLIEHNLKGLILVPTINLVTQIHKDFKDYNLMNLYDKCHLVGGEYKEKHLNMPVTISTWQSMMRIDKDELKKIDFIVIDEAQMLKVDAKSLEIVLQCTNAKYRIAMTGSLPESKIHKMSIFSVSGLPETYIRTSDLVKLGLATPLRINSIHLKYSSHDTHEFKRCANNFSTQLAYIKTHQNRNLFISKLSIAVSTQKGNTVLMCSHLQHMKDIFDTIMNQKHGFEYGSITNAHINGKHSFDFQTKYKVYLINGSTESKQRELIRNVLEHDTNSILVANYSVFSTGINIKNLSNIVFCSPLKSFVTITQSLGRALRLHVSKEYANVYDIVDMFRPFTKQYAKRVELSYNPEGFEIIEKTIQI